MSFLFHIIHEVQLIRAIQKLSGNLQFTKVQRDKWFIINSSALIDLRLSNLPCAPSSSCGRLAPAEAQANDYKVICKHGSTQGGTLDVVGACAYF